MSEPLRCACCDKIIQAVYLLCERCGQAACPQCIDDSSVCRDCRREEDIDPDCSFRDALMAFGLPPIRGGSPDRIEQLNREIDRIGLVAYDQCKVLATINPGVVKLTWNCGDENYYDAEELMECLAEIEDAADPETVLPRFPEQVESPDDDPPPLSGGSPEAEPEDNLLKDLEVGAECLAVRGPSLIPSDLDLTCREAAEEIRRLRAEVAELRAKARSREVGHIKDTGIDWDMDEQA